MYLETSLSSQATRESREAACPEQILALAQKRPRYRSAYVSGECEDATDVKLDVSAICKRNTRCGSKPKKKQQRWLGLGNDANPFPSPLTTPSFRNSTANIVFLPAREYYRNSRQSNGTTTMSGILPTTQKGFRPMPMPSFL